MHKIGGAGVWLLWTLLAAGIVWVVVTGAPRVILESAP